MHRPRQPETSVLQEVTSEGKPRKPGGLVTRAYPASALQVPEYV